MHIQDCLDPKRIVNPYTHEVQIVPCGNCSACQNARASRWVQRLDQERYCWQYCLFFTLTYNNDSLPLLKRSKSDLFYYDSSSEHYDIVGRGKSPFIDINEHIASCAFNVSLLRSESSWIKSHDTIPYVSVYDVQKFIKRIRINLFRKVDKNEKIRYFICSEYGPKHLRPHYHGIFFFNSDKFASELPLLIRSCWQFGFTDSSFVSGSNSRYVASYLNCTSHLPKIYECEFLRPFILCSKCPPIGTLSHNSEEIRKIFFEASPEFVIQNHSTNAFDNVSLWKTYSDRLFPRLTGFSRLSHVDRVALYRTAERIEKKLIDDLTFDKFCNIVTSSQALPVERDYVSYFRSFNDDIVNSLYRWYSISLRVLYQSSSFGISVRDYVKQIEKFVDNVEKYRLKKQFEFEDAYSCDYGSSSLIGIDKLYLQSMLDLDLGSLTYGEILQLQSFGVDIEKFYSADLTERYLYQCSLLPENTFDFQCFTIDSEFIRSKNVKTKKKNEWLEDEKEFAALQQFQKEFDLLHKNYAEF